MKVLFTSRAFDRIAGGIEHMATSMMNAMCARGMDIGLLTLDPPDAVSHYPLDSAITWTKITIGDPAVRASWRIRAARQLAMRRAVRAFAPDVIIAFQSGAFAAIRTATSGFGIPVIAAERNSPGHYDFLQTGKRQRLLANTAFLWASRITIQLESYRNKYPAILRNRIVTIANPVTPVVAPTPVADREPLIINVGRLSYQKNQAVLLRAFDQVAESYPDWRLVIIGDGENAQALKSLRQSLSHPARIEFAGAVKDVSPWYRKAAILAFPSLWEGFPNAVAEAFSHGLPALGWAACDGVNELIRDGVTGRLSPPGDDAFASQLAALMADPVGRAEMGAAAIQQMQPFRPEAIFDQWEALFRSLARS